MIRAGSIAGVTASARRSRALARAAGAAFVVLLGACATARQDPNAVTSLGIVETRVEAPLAVRPWFGWGWLQVFSGNVGVGVNAPIGASTTAGFTRYGVALADGGHVTIQSRDPTLRVGDCVRVWLVGDATGPLPLPPERGAIDAASECAAEPRLGWEERFRRAR